MFLHRYIETVSHRAAATNAAAVYALGQSIHAARQTGHTIFTCGNGGSGANASHLAQDLSKGTLVEGVRPIRAACLCDSLPTILAWANDEGYEHVFSEPLRAIGQAGDVLIAISGSGNSENVLRAVHTAHELGMRTWGVTGFDGGQLLKRAHRCVHVPCDDMGVVEAVHGILFHWLIDVLRAAEHAIADEAWWWYPGEEREA